MPDIVFQLKLNEEQFDKLQEIAGWECTELDETLHDMIEARYEQHCEDYMAYAEACGDVGNKPEPDDEMPL